MKVFFTDHSSDQVKSLDEAAKSRLRRFVMELEGSFPLILSYLRHDKNLGDGSMLARLDDNLHVVYKITKAAGEDACMIIRVEPRFSVWKELAAKGPPPPKP